MSGARSCQCCTRGFHLEWLQPRRAEYSRLAYSKWRWSNGMRCKPFLLLLLSSLFLQMQEKQKTRMCDLKVLTAAGSGDEEHPSSDTNCWEWTRLPMRKRSYNNLFKRKNLCMGDVKQHNMHTQREREAQRVYLYYQSMQQLQINNNLYKRLQSHFM